MKVFSFCVKKNPYILQDHFGPDLLSIILKRTLAISRATLHVRYCYRFIYYQVSFLSMLLLIGNIPIQTDFPMFTPCFFDLNIYLFI